MMADFFEDARTGKIALETLWWYGPELPPFMKGVSKIKRLGEDSFTRLNFQGKEITQFFHTPALLEYDGRTLVVYDPLIRYLNEEEERLMEEWERARRYGVSRKDFFASTTCPYLNGGRHGSRRYLPLRNVVKDAEARGRVAARYAVYPA